MTKTALARSRTRVEARIVELRGEKVLLDEDLAHVYGVFTKQLNQAVRRNFARFPADFVFKLSQDEWRSLKSQIVTSNAGRGGRRKLPWAFTEHGAVMAACVLNSPKAIEMSVFVVRAFVRLRELAGAQAFLAAKLADLEKQVTAHDSQLKEIIAVLKALLHPPVKPRRPIGYEEWRE